jgi:HJR/Mrr/RecB family endonuclease
LAAPRKRIKPPELTKHGKVYDSEIVEETELESTLPRARTPEAREAQLAAMAYDLAEERFRKGTASSQEIIHFLKVGSSREKQELEKLKQETILVGAKVKDLQNVEEMKQLYIEAMDAMRGYAGQQEVQVDDPNLY